MHSSNNHVETLGSNLLESAHGIRHAFFTRHGGVSEGKYYSLNCGFGSEDDTVRVKRNRAIALAQLRMSKATLITCNQFHTSNVEFVIGPWTKGQAPIADGMVTDRPDLALAILTADCAPILLADTHNGIVGAIHAGWRGALAGVIDNALNLMEKKGAKASRIIAAIGPCIGLKSYEVGEEFKIRFVNNDSENEIYFSNGKRSGKYNFDLSSYVRYRLERIGVEHISHFDYDTCADEDKFFSYRRSVLNREDNYGRAISLIALAARVFQ